MIEAPSSTPVALKDVAGSFLSPVISGQLDQERARKASIEGRAAGIVSSSGVLLAVFTGVITLLEGKDFHAPLGLLVPLALAYMLFVAGIACGIVASIIGNTLSAFGEIPAKTLRGWVDDWESAATADLAQKVANVQIGLLGDLRGQNLTKWRLLQAGVMAQLVAMLVFLGVLGILIVKPQT
jgi:integral membrane sensor domain MASE1